MGCKVQKDGKRNCPRLCVWLARAWCKTHKGAPGLTLDNPVPHSPVNTFVCICGFHLHEKRKAVKLKGRDFQTVTNPPTLLRLDIPLLHLSQGAYRPQSKISYPPLVTGQQGQGVSGALGCQVSCWMGLG